jgi:aryl-alcohol dehydrogenase-like predicted oxidoreductase
MAENRITRRQFIRGTAAAVALTPAAARSAAVLGAETPAKRTAVDQVDLGKTGLKLSRLGIGTGSQGGSIQRALGQDGFKALVRHAWDRGITYIDTADSYQIHEWVREATKGLPREKLFIQTKMGGTPGDPLAEIDRFRKELGTDYIDSLLVHCAFTKDWQEERKRVIEALEKAKEKKIIRARGVSCHSLPALERSAELPWLDVNLVRINPQGAHIDTPKEHWEVPSEASHLPAVLKAVKAMRERGRGVIGMKIIGNGDFTRPEDREKSIRFAVSCGLLDAIVVGCKSAAEVDEAIERLDRALA